MGVCLDKDVAVKDSLSVSSMPPPPSSSNRAGGGKFGPGNRSFVKPAAAAVMATKELKKQISSVTGASSADNKKRKGKKKGEAPAAATETEDAAAAGEDEAGQLSNGTDDDGGGGVSMIAAAGDDNNEGDDDAVGTVLAVSGLAGGEEHHLSDSVTPHSGVGSAHRLASESGWLSGSASRRSPLERAEVASLLMVAAETEPGGRSPVRSVSRNRRDDYRTQKASHTIMSRFPELTKPAPEFTGQAVVNGQFKQISLSDYKGKYVVLFFYPLDFTFVCPTEIISFSEKAEDFRKIGCEVIACSTDSQFSHFAWINTSRKMGGLGPMNIPLLADKTGQIARDYGCYKEDEGIAFRGLYIIDDKGRLRQITINDLPVGRSVDETLRLVQAFQYTDVHGEVCPANWKPGDATMKPDTHGSKEYFEKH